MRAARTISASSVSSFCSRSVSTMSSGRTPLPSRALLEKALKIAVHEDVRLEPDRGRARGKRAPQTRPQALRLDDHARHIADLGARLRLIAKVGDERGVPRRDQRERARAREAGHVSDVRQAA